MRLRDTIDRIKYGGARELRLIAGEARDAVLSGPGKFVVAGVSVLAIIAALVFVLRPPPSYTFNNEPALRAAQQDREALMAMTAEQFAAEEKRRETIATNAGDDDADYAIESLERVKQVREARTRSLVPSTESP